MNLFDVYSQKENHKKGKLKKNFEVGRYKQTISGSSGMLCANGARRTDSA